jgi:hypothetical protein
MGSVRVTTRVCSARGIARRTSTLLAAFSLACQNRCPDDPPPVLTVSLGLSSTSVLVGDAVTSSIEVEDEHRQPYDNDVYTLVSSNPSVVTITQPANGLPGRVQGVAAGTTQITASVSMFGLTFTSEPVTLTVSARPIATVDVDAPVTSISEDGTTTVTATARDDRGNQITNHAVPTWTLSNVTVATFTASTTNPNQITLTGLAPGNVTVSGTIAGITGQEQFTITPAPVQTVTLTLTPPNVVVGQTASATATFRSAGGKSLSGTAQFSSSDITIATVTPSTTNGLQATVTAVGAGSATITATSPNNVRASQSMTITLPPIATLDVNLPKLSIDVGETMTATVTAKDGQGNVVPTPTGVTFTSTNPAAATVNATTGLVTGVGAGQTDIRGTLGAVQGFKGLQVLSPTNLSVRWAATGAFTSYVIEAGTNLGYAAGRNDLGQGGVNYTSPTIAGFTVMSGGHQWKQLDAGTSHWAGLTLGGDVYTGGENSNGQLGDGTTTNRSAPTRVNLPDKAWLVRAGAFNTCAALNDGALFCWGSNQYGQVRSPAGGNEHFPEYLAGNPSQPVTAIGIGEHHVCYLRANVAGLWCRGFNNSGQLGDGTTTNRANFVWAIMPPQTGAGAVTFTMPGLAQASQAADDMRFPLSAGHHSTCFAPLEENIDAAALNLYVLCTGNNQLRDVSDAPTASILSPDWRLLPAIRLQFRERSAFGSFATAGIAGIMGGFTSNKVHTTDGRILGIGFGFWGNFGNGVFVNEPQWVVMAGGQRFAKVASSPVAYHTCAIDDSAALWCWGRNDYGQLGIGSTSTRETTPRRISKSP